MSTDDALRDANAVGIDFMRTELSLGLEFAAIAADAASTHPQSTDKRDRNRVNAQKAYDALLKFLPRLTLSADEAAELGEGVEQLRLAIEAIPR